MGRPILSPGKKLTGEKTDRYTGPGSNNGLGTNYHLLEHRFYTSMMPLILGTLIMSDLYLFFGLIVKYASLLLPSIHVYSGHFDVTIEDLSKVQNLKFHIK